MSTIRIKQIRSAIRKPENQKASIKDLVFSKLNQEIEKEATPQILGMINKVKHLVEVIEK